MLLLATLAAASPALGAPTTHPVETPEARLRRRLARLATWRGGYQGIHVIDESGRELFSRRGKLPFNPASNAKVITVATALWALGPAHRFSTELLGEVSEGHVAGPLYLRGGGDPSLEVAGLRRLVATLVARGVRTVRGPLIVDDSAFRLPAAPPDYGAFRTSGAYRAVPSALTLHSNVVGITVVPAARAGLPAAISVQPASDYFRLQTRVYTTWRRTRLRVQTYRHGAAHTGVVVGGRIKVGSPTFHTWKRVHHPVLFAGRTLQVLLEQAGIELSRGRIRRGRTPSETSRIAVHRSAALGAIARATLKHSINVRAELLWLAAGAALYGVPATYEKGQRAVAAFLAQAGIRRGTYRLRNGSGLSRRSRFRPADMARLLRTIHRDFAFGPELLAGLPLAGGEGTLAGFYRRSSARGLVRAKTGTLSGASCLSGYVHAGEGWVYFSFMSARIRKVHRLRWRHVAMTATLAAYLRGR